jgi:hypothetical protein
VPPKPAEPNRLRQAVPPNTLRGFDTPVGSWLANGATRGARAPRGAPPVPRAGGSRRASIDPRVVGRIGLLLAVAGLLPLLNAEFRWEETGLGLVSAGLGLMLVAAFPGILRSKAVTTRRSGSSPWGTLLAASYWAAVPVIGGCLLAVGAFLLADAVSRG